ncbi:hypothetical protein MBLNU459_g1181t1 [Dothideomycetes sp. NU459]
MNSALVALFASLAAAAPAPAYYSNSSSSSANTTTSSACNGTFTPITAAAWVAGVNPGWNLGNTLEATPTEGDWNNPAVVPSTFDYVKAQGFNGVRLPVTYADHFTTGSPTWDIDPAWLQRVSDVIDEVIARDMYVITNLHGDAYLWADLTASGANYTMIEEKFYRAWYQIGTKLGCKSSLLAFEPINEPPASTSAEIAELNKLQQIFVQALSDSGGFNSQRVVTLNGPGEDSAKTSENFVRPTNISNPWAIQYHYYSPYDFVFSAWGKTIWGSDADKAALEEDMANIRGNFTDVPLLIGEWSAAPEVTETAARWKYFDFIVRTAKKYNTSTMLWDNGLDYLNRANGQWRDQVAIDIFMAAKDGVNNSLPDSTESQSATTQFTSADIFHQYGTNVTSQTIPYLLNGNTLTAISSSTGNLTQGTDYTVTGDNVTFAAQFLSKYFSATTTPGSIANLTLTFSAGASLTANLVQWDTPVLGSTTSAASAVASGSALTIPITWKGINKPAAVKAETVTGTYLVDTYTQYFGPLQAGRTTYSNQWTFDSDSVTITAATVADVVSAGADTVFTFEFYPRIPANTVNYTLTA